MPAVLTLVSAAGNIGALGTRVVPSEFRRPARAHEQAQIQVLFVGPGQQQADTREIEHGPQEDRAPLLLQLVKPRVIGCVWQLEVHEVRGRVRVIGVVFKVMNVRHDPGQFQRLAQDVRRDVGAVDDADVIAAAEHHPKQRGLGHIRATISQFAELTPPALHLALEQPHDVTRWAHPEQVVGLVADQRSMLPDRQQRAAVPPIGIGLDQERERWDELKQGFRRR